MVNLFKGEVGDGSSLRFWTDWWMGLSPLALKYPSLYKLERVKDCRICDRITIGANENNGMWNWKRKITSASERDEWEAMVADIQGIVTHKKNDCWKWMGSRNGEFTVAKVKEYLYNKEDRSQFWKLERNKWLPNKCDIFFWRVCMNRIPILTALAARNIPVESTDCVFCQEKEETIEHLFGECSVATEVWLRIAAWCHTPPIFFFNIKDVASLHEHCGLTGHHKDIFRGIVVTTVWCIWLARNEKVYQSKDTTAVEIVNQIKTIGFFWLKHRGRRKSVEWKDWVSFSFFK